MSTVAAALEAVPELREIRVVLRGRATKRQRPRLDQALLWADAAPRKDPDAAVSYDL